MSNHRLQQLEQTLERILSALEQHYQPEQVIVFGSLCVGAGYRNERSRFIDR